MRFHSRVEATDIRTNEAVGLERATKIYLCIFKKQIREQETMEKTMKFLKYLLPFALATCGFTATLQAQDDNGYSTTIEERERDMQAIQDFVKTKRLITVAEKGGNLMISGDVRAEWEHLRAKTRGKNQRGKGSANLGPASLFNVDGRHPPYPTNEFDIEANLMFDYRTDRTWAAIQLQFDNTAGIREVEIKQKVNDSRNSLFGSGKLNNIVLRKAYMGYNVLEQGTSRFDIELGRRRMYDVFDSKIQFYSFFDAALLRFASSFEGITDLTFKTAAFVVDQTVNHFGYITEVGLLNIADTGLDFKYSWVHWNKNGVNRWNKHHPHGARYINNQYTLAYNISPDLIPYKTQLYGAFLHNQAAQSLHRTHHKKAANAWYAGVKMGEVKRRNDWAIDANYQWVQAQSIIDSDVSGIGRDNPRGISYWSRVSQGFANYKGYKIDTFYALTDNLTINAYFERVHQCERAIGGKHRSYAFQLAAIYAF